MHRKVHLCICSALNSSQTQKVARGCPLSEPSVRLTGKSSVMIRPSTWPWEFMVVERCRQPNMLASMRKHRFALSGCAQFTEGAGTAKECGRKEPLTVPKLVIKTNTVCASSSTLHLHGNGGPYFCGRIASLKTEERWLQSRLPGDHGFSEKFRAE